MYTASLNITGIDLLKHLKATSILLLVNATSSTASGNECLSIEASPRKVLCRDSRHRVYSVLSVYTTVDERNPIPNLQKRLTNEEIP